MEAILLTEYLLSMLMLSTFFVEAAFALPAVAEAYKKLGFTVTIDPSVNYGGCFNAHSRSIILRFENETIYHELGHFLAFVAGNVYRTSDFAAVYNSEKSKFTGINRSYATQNGPYISMTLWIRSSVILFRAATIAAYVFGLCLLSVDGLVTYSSTDSAKYSELFWS